MNGLAVSSDSSRSRARSTFVAITGVPPSSAVLRLAGGVEVGEQRLVASRLLLQPRDRLLQRLQVGQDHLGLDRGEVAGGVHLAVDVGDVVVAEDPGDLADRGRLADVGEELVAQPLPLRGAAHDAGDVHELDRGRHQSARTRTARQARQPRVGYADDADVRLDRRERVVRREHVVLGQRVEERGLAGVGKSDDADGESHDREPYVADAGQQRIATGPRIAQHRDREPRSPRRSRPRRRRRRPG